MIRLDNFNFDITVINLAEKRVIEMVKCIRGELPLPGLVERIDACLDLIDKCKNNQLEDTN